VDNNTIQLDADHQISIIPAPRPAGLHIVGGVHLGAVITIAMNDTLLIGSSNDCEVILADPEVAKHHCMLTGRGASIGFRPVDAPIRVNGRVHSPGETGWVTPGARVEMGSAALEVGDPAGGPSAAHTRQSGRGRGMRLLRRSRWGIAAVVAVAVACELHPVTADTLLAAAERSVGNTEEAQEPVTRTGTAVAQDVGEVLRLSGINGEARYDSNGTVTVRGHLGDPQAVATVMQSRAMHEIKGLERVEVVNLDSPSAVPNDESHDTHWIVSAISSRDPYVIATDGSRYYVGATLPRGGRLAGVQDGEILVQHGDGQVEHLRLSAAPRLN
jgi:hypothetical protein